MKWDKYFGSKKITNHNIYEPFLLKNKNITYQKIYFNKFIDSSQLYNLLPSTPPSEKYEQLTGGPIKLLSKCNDL